MVSIVLSFLIFDFPRSSSIFVFEDVTTIISPKHPNLFVINEIHPLSTNNKTDLKKWLVVSVQTEVDHAYSCNRTVLSIGDYFRNFSGVFPTAVYIIKNVLSIHTGRADSQLNPSDIRETGR